MKLLLDMNMSPRLAAYLRDAGVGAIHWSDIADARSTDQEIAEFASTNGMTVVTHDLDFGALLSRSGLQSPSVVQIRADDLSVDALGAKLVAVLNDLASELQTGALVTLDPVRVRYRVLPLRRQ